MKHLTKHHIAKTGEVASGVAVAGGLLWLSYELIEFIKYKSFKHKNPASALTFAQYKVQYKFERVRAMGY
jgi:hypothetical protein